jgi:hypothetical protein
MEQLGKQMDLGPIRKASEEQRVVGGTRRKKHLALLVNVLEEVTRKSLHLPGGLQISQEGHTEHPGNCQEYRMCSE